MVPLSFIQKSQLRTDFTTEALRHPYIRSIAIKEILGSRFSTAAFQFQSSQWEIEVSSTNWTCQSQSHIWSW